MGVTLYAVRHAPTDALGRCIGRTDVSTEVPAHHAARCVERALVARPEHVWSSPLSRCAEVASLLAGAFGVDHRVDERLLEVDFGAWEGRAWSDIEAEDGEALSRWMADWQRVAPPGGETVAALEARVRAWHDQLGPGTHLLVGHAGVIRALRVLGGASWDDSMGRPAPHLELERLR